eukprot:NODE_132_length_18298_cov_0.443101.p11 type:complete len:125 gc:universal NODE_132_length_18298_cov_0.443101:13982-13608(-)
MSDFDATAKSFVDFYYNTFDQNRSNLAGLYRDMSMLSFEGNQCQGTANITEKLMSLPFQKVVHKVDSIDAQPSYPDGKHILVSVTGQLLVDDSEQPIKFSQVFFLVNEGGSYYVFNDIFRLNYG